MAYCEHVGVNRHVGGNRITGRSKNVIVTRNGKNIFPEEVEIYINSSPAVAESIVFGDDTGDETVVSAAVYPDIESLQNILNREEITKDDIKKAVSQAIKDANRKLPNYKKIRSYYISDEEFIKTTTKKIKRQVNIDKIMQDAKNKINTEE